MKPPGRGVLFDIGRHSCGTRTSNNESATEQFQLDSGYYIEVPTGLTTDDVHEEVNVKEEDVEGPCESDIMSVTIRYEKEVHEWKVCPHDTVQTLQLFVQNRWGIEPARQRLLIDGLPTFPTLRLGLLGDGVEFQVLNTLHGGGSDKGGRSRKRGGKGSAKRAAKNRSNMRQTLLYEEVKGIMEARSRPNEEVSFREYEEEMEEQMFSLSKAKDASLLSERAYEKKLEKLKVPIYGNLRRIEAKPDDCIHLMSVNVNGIAMTKRGNSKADRLRQLISQYQLDAVGIQEVCVNWGEYKASNTLAAVLRSQVLRTGP